MNIMGEGRGGRRQRSYLSVQNGSAIYKIGIFSCGAPHQFRHFWWKKKMGHVFSCKKMATLPM